MYKLFVRLPAVFAAFLFIDPVSAITINLVPDAGLAANPAALGAFQRAANAWQSELTDPITITINAGLSITFSNGAIIGSTSAVSLQADYTTIRNAVVADGVATHPILATLPTAANFSATLPSGRSLSGNLGLSKADAKALGFTGLDPAFGASDGTITFNSNFTFDYDSTNGVTAGETDFQTVATHEIGHALGFTSVVDEIDQTTAAQLSSITPTTLDLFRFAGTTAVDPLTFATGARNYVPGTEDVTSDAMVGYRMSTGLTNGDLRQASHWKDDDLTGQLIGIIDPTLGSGIAESISAADLRAMDLIGYDVVPEPSMLALAGLSLLALRRRPT